MAPYCNVESVIGSVHFVDVDNVANIPEVCAVSGVTLSRLGYSSCLCRCLFQQSNYGKVGLVDASLQ
jgi:hypothetical protein